MNSNGCGIKLLYSPKASGHRSSRCRGGSKPSLHGTPKPLVARGEPSSRGPGREGPCESLAVSLPVSGEIAAASRCRMFRFVAPFFSRPVKAVRDDGATPDDISYSKPSDLLGGSTCETNIRCHHGVTMVSACCPPPRRRSKTQRPTIDRQQPSFDSLEAPRSVGAKLRRTSTNFKKRHTNIQPTMSIHIPHSSSITTPIHHLTPHRRPASGTPPQGPHARSVGAR